MNQGINSQRSTPDNDVRDIPKWARRYAQTREVLPGTLSMLVPFAAMAALIVPFALLQEAGYYLLALVWGIIAVGVWIVCLWVLRVRAGGPFLSAIEPAMTLWIYRREGQVSTPSAQGTKRSPRWVAWLGIIIMVAPLALLPEWESLPSQYWQPLAAILWVPYFTYLILRPPQGVDSSHPILLLWPGLYALHAILILAGVPLHITGSYEGLTMWVSLGVCNIITDLAAHIYSRYALRRLRTLATSPEETGGGQ